jgi:hypothetical protein
MHHVLYLLTGRDEQIKINMPGSPPGRLPCIVLFTVFTLDIGILAMIR